MGAPFCGRQRRQSPQLGSFAASYCQLKETRAISVDGVSRLVSCERRLSNALVVSVKQERPDRFRCPSCERLPRPPTAASWVW